ncbi:major facilitator superfamily domain-containing protein 4A-like [Haliotis asinina]|uniref:major facilitator superfamily domain-containing protein 4A-like n=1 Tax=Haliotis asinina TaxID=109174 RepID=UPI003531B6B4
MGMSKSTPCLYLEMALLLAIAAFDGIIDSCFGPSLQDLHCLYSVTVQTISTLFPLYVGTKTAGCLLYVPLHGVISDYTLMMGCLLGSWLVLLIPLCPSYWLAAAASVGLGLTGGVAISACVARTGELSYESTISFHLFGLAACAGHILGPLTMSPFLSNISPYRNRSNITGVDLELTADQCDNSESKIIYAYLIFALCGLILAILLAVLHHGRKNDPWQSPCQEEHESFGKVELILIGLLFILMFIGGGTNFVYGSLLLLFGIHSRLHVPENTLVLLTSSFYTVTMFGRIGAVFVSFIVSQSCLISTCLVGLLAASVFLVFTAEISLLYLWVCSHILALFYAPLYAGLIAWCVENIRVNNTVCAVFTFCDLAGTSLVALALGQLMSVFEPQMLHYSVATIAVAQILLYLCIFLLQKQVQKNTNEKYTVLSDTSVTLKEKYQLIPRHFIQNLVESVGRRCQAAIDANGGHTRY